MFLTLSHSFHFFTFTTFMAIYVAPYTEFSVRLFCLQQLFSPLIMLLVWLNWIILGFWSHSYWLQNLCQWRWVLPNWLIASFRNFTCGKFCSFSLLFFFPHILFSYLISSLLSLIPLYIFFAFSVLLYFLVLSSCLICHWFVTL